MNKKLISMFLLGVVVTACSDSTSSGNAGRLAPLVDATGNQTFDAAPNEYIVVLKKGADAQAEASVARAAGGYVMNVWKASLNGYAIRANAGTLAAIRRSNLVDFVQPNLIMTIDVAQPCAPPYTTCSWGLDRIDETGAPLDGIYNQPPQAPNQGAGVHEYTIDTGIRFTHTQFGGRAVSGFDFVNNDADASDDNGHGTHVSGTIGGMDYGVAKRVNLTAIKVCNAGGSCPTNAIVSGINWVQTNSIHPAAANMSLGGGANPALDNAVTAAIASGVTFGIAAGNNNGDACLTSPARVPTAITVASSGNGAGVPPAQLDNRSSFSNFGACVDIFAPGNNIKSAWNTSDVATNIISGTSMATPHVVGAAVLYLDIFPTKTPAQVAAALVANGTIGAIINPGALSPNVLLNVNRPHRP